MNKANIISQLGTLLLAGLITWPSHAATSPVGATAGSFKVSEAGAATYSIPIAVPPGIAGMQPSLSLTYSSQGGNGLLGMGWNLGGLSVIHRCPKTVVQDGTKGGINLDANDRYCLDGQRLVAITGAYGAANTEYRTETESYSRIISYGAQGTGPSYWKVWTKSGQVMEYGNSANAKIEAQGKTEVMLWALSKVQDTVGNYLTVTYTEDNTNGQYYPTRIDYTGNANTGKMPTNSIQFSYETRPDITPLYQAGSLMKKTVRMAKISTYAGATMVREYRLVYGQGVATARSRLASLTECAADGVCLSPTSFVWSDFTPGFKPAVSWASVADITVWKLSLADVNGDGKADANYFIAGGDMQVALSEGSTFGQLNTWASWWGGALLQGFTYTSTSNPDFNGDGLADVAAVSTGFFNAGSAGLSSGGSFVGQVLTVMPGGGFGQNQLRYIDADGDGRSDALFYNGSSVINAYLSTNGIYYNLPARAWGAVSGSPSADQIQYADVNGDGLVDLIVQTTDNKFMVGLSNGLGFQAQIQWVQQAGSFVRGQAQFADVNGDGLPDLVLQDGNNAFWVSLSTGVGFVAPQKWAQLTGNFVENQVAYLDVNFDGIADLVHQDNSNNFTVALSTGTSFQTPVLWIAVGGSFSAAKYGDLDGNGSLDLVIIDSASSLQAVLSKGSLPDLLTSLTNGLNATTSITYKPLTDSSVYTKDTGAVYPYLDLQAPMYVVSRVTNSDGIGGAYAMEYSYTGAKAHLQGGGYLGFKQVTAHDPQTGIKSSSVYRQDYPYAGLPLTSEKRTDSGVLLNQATNTYSNTLLNPTASPVYHQSLLTMSVEQSYELNGSLVTTVTTNSQYDAYGNPTQIVVSTGDGYSKTTNNTYDNTIDSTRWFLGRLKRSTVTSVTP